MGATFLGMRLKNLRSQEGMTQQDVAKATGVARSAIGMYESGDRSPDFEMLEKLADLFNVPIGSFFPDHTAPNKEQLTEKVDELSPIKKKVIRKIKTLSDDQIQVVLDVINLVAPEGK